jgi:hypothetical protein
MTYQIIDTRTGQVVDQKHTLRAAIRRVDALDSAYGGSRYAYRAVPV